MIHKTRVQAERLSMLKLPISLKMDTDVFWLK